MPRIAGISPPKYRKHRASGQAIVTLGGKDHYLGPHGTVASRREYDRLIREWYASGGVSVAADKRDEITIVELLAAFMRHAKGHYGPDSTEPANSGRSSSGSAKPTARRWFANSARCG